MKNIVKKTIQVLFLAAAFAASAQALKARNAGDFTRCKVAVNDGVVYVCPATTGLFFSIR